MKRFLSRHQALIGFVACLVIIAGTIGYVARESRRNARESARTLNALCALRGDLTHRINASTAFLKDHPQGIPGVPLKVIEDGIANQRRTVHALRKLHCH